MVCYDPTNFLNWCNDEPDHPDDPVATAFVSAAAAVAAADAAAAVADVFLLSERTSGVSLVIFEIVVVLERAQN